MTQQGTILVTGATGNVGGHVVSELVESGATVRALVRDPSTARLPEGVEVVRGDLSDPDSLAAPLDGVDSVFLVFPTLRADAAASGVISRIAEHARGIVYLSADGVPDDPEVHTTGIIASHAHVERLIEESGLEWTFLRSGGMATNTLGWATLIRSQSVVRWPYGEAARSLVHEADLATVAARVLTGTGHDRAKYVLTGSAVLTQIEQARAIGEAIGRPVHYEELSHEQAREQLTDGWGWPAETADGALDAWASMVGDTGGVTDTIEELTGKPPRTFAEWARDHADDFR